MTKRIATLLSVGASGVLWANLANAAPDVAALEALGKQVFFDEVSDPPRQACATCHVPSAGWTGPIAAINMGQVAMPGADPHSEGNRKPPTASYASFAPSNLTGCLGIPAVRCVGGIFWDGRADGSAIGYEVFDGDPDLIDAYEDFLGPTADQALGPFANDAEQNVPDGETELAGATAVCEHVASAKYAELFELAWGVPPDCDDDADLEFKRIAVAISAYEHSYEVNSFSSFRDFALANDADHASPLDDFTDEENLGHFLFYTPRAAGGAGCVACHNSEGAGASGDEPKQLYTDHRFHNIGLPPNYAAANFDPANPDIGLGGVTGEPGQAGSFRTTTLRNVDQRVGNGFTKAYMHNGYFKSLEQVVHFYNTAKVKPVCPMSGASAAEAIANDCWPPPENPVGVAPGVIVGALGLSPDQEAALVAYLKTLSDTVVPNAPKPYKPSH